MTDFAGKVVLVTGGANGIGRALCSAFVTQGARVLCADRDRAAADALVQSLTGPGELRFEQADLGCAADCERVAAAAVDAWGGVDVLCNNVGISPLSSYVRAHELPDETWERIIGVNLTSYFRMAKHCLPAMLRAGAGVIINMASVQGLQSAPGVAAYAASKGGILSLTRQLAIDYAADGIRVLAVNPGSIDTPMGDEVVELLGRPKEEMLAEWAQAHPLGRVGQPDDVADVVLFLASDKARFMTGEFVNVDGGAMAKGSWADAES
jgi:NAD(P)-dependent dehydrogenase (short-subunit alcohol dehydrogenase family)